MRTVKTILGVLALTLFSPGLSAQDPVTFKVSSDQPSNGELVVTFTGSIASGWHVYSTALPDGGPTSATINIDDSSGIEQDGPLKAEGAEIETFDSLFGMDLRYFENSVTFIQKFKITASSYSIKGYLEYGTCNDSQCMPPTAVDFSYSGNGPKAAAPSKNPAPKAEPESASSPATVPETPAVEPEAVPAEAVALTSGENLWTPVIDELAAFGTTGSTRDRTLMGILIMGFLGGLVALFTPCVWPIIPMTISFFLKRNKKDKKKGIREAIIYGLSIVIIYVSLGLLVTGIFGANALNSLATNAFFNLFFFLLLVVFAVSFFGWFEIRLPSKWSNAMDRRSEATTGLLSIFLMAFTLTLVSFSCTGPIIGFLLVDFATSGSMLAPAIGMLGFALGLAIPFTLFAVFPTWLSNMPRSGGWMNTIKVVLGFIELAFAFKFFSVADMAYGWNLLTREWFLAFWIVIFAMLGAYLFGWLRFPSDYADGEPGPKGVPAIMTGMLSFALAVYMIPGMWGAPCKAVSAFAPPMYTQDFNLNDKTVEAEFTDYDAGMAYAKAHGKPVLLDFTGFGCVNCRKMEAAVWTDPGVAGILTKDYVLISLYVDDKTPLKEHIEVEVNGQKRTLRSIGDKWSYLQQVKFGALAQPFYVQLNNDGMPLNGAFVYQEDIPAYTRWLRSGLEKYKAR